jgi:ADP-ribose pyrophosphatase YjhB (NUDIX family)
MEADIDMNKVIVEYLKRVQAIAKTGLSYAEDAYDLERYEELKVMTNNMLSDLTGFLPGQISAQFDSLDTYPTPKIDVRGLVLKGNEVLLIQEKSDTKWALPGGWCDVGYSPSENIVKEVSEEAGLEVTVSRLLAVWDKRKHDHPLDVNSVYKLNFLCEIVSGIPSPGDETMDARFFPINDLPPLSLMRNTPQQILRLVELAQSGEVDFD